jgi:hypothetical protein
MDSNLALPDIYIYQSMEKQLIIADSKSKLIRSTSRRQIYMEKSETETKM